MRRTKLVLAALAVMVAMLVVLSAPALADNKNKKHHGDRNNDHVVFVDNDGFNRFHDDDFKCCHGDFFDDVEFDIDDDHHFISSGFSPFFSPFFVGCWEWSWVFERWEWDCD